MRPSLGREWEEGVEEAHPGTQDTDVTKIPELTRSLEMTRGSASMCDLSGHSTKDEDETCTGEQEHGKTPTALSSDEGIEQRPGLGPRVA